MKKIVLALLLLLSAISVADEMNEINSTPTVITKTFRSKEYSGASKTYRIRVIIDSNTVIDQYIDLSGGTTATLQFDATAQIQ